LPFYCLARPYCSVFVRVSCKCAQILCVCVCVCVGARAHV
jgi:hypothetical protein